MDFVTYFCLAICGGLVLALIVGKNERLTFGYLGRLVCCIGFILLCAWRMLL